MASSRYDKRSCSPQLIILSLLVALCACAVRAQDSQPAGVKKTTVIRVGITEYQPLSATYDKYTRLFEEARVFVVGGGQWLVFRNPDSYDGGFLYTGGLRVLRADCAGAQRDEQREDNQLRRT